jgi:hypothetical protein
VLHPSVSARLRNSGDTAAERARVFGYGQATVLCCCMTRYNLALGAAAAQNYWRKNYP